MNQSKTAKGMVLFNKDEEKKYSESNLKEDSEVSLSNFQDNFFPSRDFLDEDNSINSVKDFSAKSSRIFEDIELLNLNDSAISQSGKKPFSYTNTSLSSGVKYRPSTSLLTTPNFQETSGSKTSTARSEIKGSQTHFTSEYQKVLVNFATKTIRQFLI